MHYRDFLLVVDDYVDDSEITFLKEGFKISFNMKFRVRNNRRVIINYWNDANID
jgi:hypothetical protein